MTAPKIATDPAGLLRARVESDPSRPFVTYYDDARGERVELSARVFDNWVAKTANFLVDGLGAQPGDDVVLALPEHWQTLVWLMASWSAGLHVHLAEPGPDAPDGLGTPDGPDTPDGLDAPDGPYFLAVAEEDLARVDGSGAEEVVGLSLHALGGPMADVPPGVTDYAVEVRAHGDRFRPERSYADDPLLTVTKTTYTGADLVGEARKSASEWGLDARDRLLVHVPLATSQGVLITLLAPLASGSSVIIQRNFDKASLDRRLTLEHVTAVAGVPAGTAAPNAGSGPVRRLG
ncbi:TIGR03089 family protein [Actinomadura logoneensis]|uniref:TIGR03089 family protein n=1 Tax=Actinomadura logoneensis TaxID=2293572 RepID=A0A372JJ83_9ACTN|nr:TIGR03089 family protein [Actinomadura logoneensis]RFU40081.1 TIGR03089 family protein [Actinomadura logoneensis]